MLSSNLLEAVKGYQETFDLQYDLPSIEKLETIIDSIKTAGDKEMLDKSIVIWSLYFGEALVNSFEGSWLNHLQVQLFNGEIVYPLELIENYVKDEQNNSLINFYGQIHVSYFNANYNYKENDDLSDEEKKNKTIKSFNASMGMQGFVQINSTDDFVKIEENKLQVRLLMKYYEEIYPGLKQLKEYKELQKLSLSSDEAKLKLEEIKQIVAKGHVVEMTKLYRDYYFGDKDLNQDYNEAFFWALKAAESSKIIHKVGKLFVGILYCTGKGCTPDAEKGLYWINESSKEGHSDAQCLLKLFEEEGDFEEQYKLVINIIEKTRQWDGHY